MKLKVNLEQMFKSFFELNDWKERVFFFTGLQVFNFLLTMMLLGIGMFTALVPVVGFIIGCTFYIFAILVSILIPLYIMGYRLDIAEALMRGDDLTSVKVSDDYSSRIKEGFKMMLGNLLYIFPVLLPLLLIMAVIFAGIVAAENGSDLGAVVAGMSMIVWMLLIFVVLMVIFFIQLFILPALQIHYLRNNRRLESVMDYAAIWKLAKKYALDCLLVGLLFAGIAFVMGFVMELAFFTIFLIVGLLLFPLLLGFYTVYFAHLQAELVGQLAAHETKYINA